MTRVVQAIAVTAAALGPLVLVLFAPSAWGYWLAAAYLVALFCAIYALSDSHKEKFSLLRNAELDVLFDRVFSDYESDLTRFPFRVHVFRRSGMFPIEQLTMIYSYRTHTADPDRALGFRRYFGQQGQGLVWQTCENGDVRYFRSADVEDAKSTFHLKQSQAAATREVAAILTFPLRDVRGQGSPNQSPIGVLSFDALSAEAANSLGLLFAQFRAGEQPELAALVDRISLYV